MSNYQEMKKINVNDKIEKKNGLSYLSWAWAVDQLLTHDASATWEYQEPKKFGETLMVFCTVTAFGKSMTAQLPVMDYRNKAIPNPDAFAVNTAMQRCLAKAISLHGIGLYIYAGEDLPESEHATESVKNELPEIKSVQLSDFDDEKQSQLKELISYMDKAVKDNAVVDAYTAGQSLTNGEKNAIWFLLDSKTRTALKKYAETQQH